MVSDQLLEEAGVLGEASVSEWPLFFVPLADDVLSLELEDAVSDLYLVYFYADVATNRMTDFGIEERPNFHVHCCQGFDDTATETRSLSAHHWQR
jgi:hypothetical protein